MARSVCGRKSERGRQQDHLALELAAEEHETVRQIHYVSAWPSSFRRNVVQFATLGERLSRAELRPRSGEVRSELLVTHARETNETPPTHEHSLLRPLRHLSVRFSNSISERDSGDSADWQSDFTHNFRK